MAVIDRVLVGEVLIVEHRPDASSLDLKNVAHIDLMMTYLSVSVYLSTRVRTWMSAFRSGTTVLLSKRSKVQLPVSRKQLLY